MPQVELLAASDPAQARRWDGLVTGSATPDTYYRPGYVRAYEVEGHGQAVALHLESRDASFLFPSLLRPISALPFAAGSPERDAITAYGYGGLLCLTPSRPSPAQVGDAMTALVRWCKSQRIISCMLRLHPLLEQEKWFDGTAVPGVSLHPFGPTTAIPLADWSESRMRKGRRSDLSVARRSLRLTWSDGARSDPTAPALSEALLRFRELYEGTMDRLGASAFYHFSPPYYAALAEALGDALAVALAWQDETPVGGSIFFSGREFAHYHLSATSDAGRSLKATTLLIREGIEWARTRGCAQLHLGGGAGGDDSLLDFKKGFGGEMYHYAFAGLICDRPRYDELVAKRRERSSVPLRPNFFPAYRA